MVCACVCFCVCLSLQLRMLMRYLFELSACCSVCCNCFYNNCCCKFPRQFCIYPRFQLKFWLTLDLNDANHIVIILATVSFVIFYFLELSLEFLNSLYTLDLNCGSFSVCSVLFWMYAAATLHHKCRPYNLNGCRASPHSASRPLTAISMVV